jgi:hypothetical protein
VIKKIFFPKPLPREGIETFSITTKLLRSFPTFLNHFPERGLKQTKQRKVNKIA